MSLRNIDIMETNETINRYIPTEYSNEVKANKILFAAFDSGYKACVKETLNWLREKGDDYVWFFEDNGGLTEDMYDDLERYLNSKLEVNDL